MSVPVNELALEAECGVLGSMLTDPETVGPLLHRLTPEDFLEGKYRLIFQTIRNLQSQGTVPDPVTVNAALGGTCRELLAGILEVTVTSANAEEYAAICRRTALQYRRAELGRQLADGDPERQEEIVDKLTALSCEKPGARITGLRQCFEEFLDRHADGKRPAYFTWGIPALDERVYVEPGDFIVLGGYPSAGKTALALQMAVHIAASRRTGYFYYENNDRKLFDRLVALRAGVSFGKIKRYDLQEEDFERIAAARNALTAPALEFIDASGMTAADVRAFALSRHYDLAVVDYLQKIPGSRERRGLSDFQRVSEVSSDLQNLGRQTGVTVLALSQLSRPDSRSGKPPAPGMHAFRQSGQIEQDADVALLLYKEDEAKPGRVLKIGKNKEGQADLAVRLSFDGDAQTFRRAPPQAPSEARRKRPDFREGPREAEDEEENPFWEGDEAG